MEVVGTYVDTLDAYPTVVVGTRYSSREQKNNSPGSPTALLHRLERII